VKFGAAVLSSLSVVKEQVAALASAASTADLDTMSAAGGDLIGVAYRATATVRDHRPCAARLRHARELVLDGFANAGWAGMDAQQAVVTLREGGQPHSSLGYYRSEMQTFGRKLEAAARLIREETSARQHTSSSPSRETPQPRPVAPAGIAFFVGGWGGHDRGLTVTRSGSGHEFVSDGCCDQAIALDFQISHVAGTPDNAKAIGRVTAITVHDPSYFTNGLPAPHVGEMLTLQLRNGMVIDPLTESNYCNETQENRGACGA
jgi:hypothetical protein